MTITRFVLWSGGADSTYLLQQSLRDPRHGLVLAGYFYIENNAAKAASELRAIERMCPVLERMGPFAYLGVLGRVSFEKTNPRLAYKQIPVWILALIEALHPKVDEVAIGYIKNSHPGEEDASSHIADIRRIYEAYRPLMHRDLPALCFPIAEVSKEQVLVGLDPALRAACVYCEYPVEGPGGEYAPCGRCRVCQARAAPDLRAGAPR
jgi:7-cyano-7-deazaguanine synthase in queuosine biosynthesis